MLTNLLNPGVSKSLTRSGIDVDEQGNGMVSEPRMYQLIRQLEPIVDRLFDIEFVGPGVEAFDFTFG
ncbi:MAG TPA: hypothetical protein VLR46_09390 [Candidatus Dormibacteraeota bacterium]|nr:hypothetical protein [Candidatus Dormibacteraeota bacterium]